MRERQDGTKHGTRRLTRRATLAGAGGLVAGLAGCVGGATEHSSDGEYTAVASFFTFYDFARKVADGTAITVENLVPTGLHGHGWEPDPSITRDIVDADAFLHVGPDFQPWADRAIQTVRDDETDTHLVNVREGIDLIPLAESLDEEEEVGNGRDPHFWLDPTRATAAVDNIVDGLATVAPDEEPTLRDNATAVKDELAAVDSEWQRIFSEGHRNVVFLAAHNAFEYLARRYEVTIEPLVTNLAAEGDVRPADMRRAQETIAEHDIRSIGAAVFEPRRPARQLREDTTVEAYYPVTPYAGTTAAWVDRGWGYVEIARNINMPTFETVLGSEPPAEFDAEWRNFE